MNYTSPIQPHDSDKHKESANKSEVKGTGNVVKIIAIVVGVIIVFVSGIIMLVFSMLSGVTDASNTFMDALKQGNPGIAYESTSEGFKEQGSSDDFETFVSGNPILKDIESYSFSSYNMVNDYGSARGTITAKDGQVSPVMLELVKENDEWKVLNIDLNPPAEVDDDDFEESSTEFMDI